MMAEVEGKEWEDYITWSVENFPFLVENVDGFAEFSPPFYMPETLQTEWQLELTSAYDYKQFFTETASFSTSKQRIDFRLRLIQKDASVFPQGRCGILIFCLFMNSKDEYIVTFYKRETFDEMHTSWSSQDISFEGQLHRFKDGLLNIRMKLEVISERECCIPSHKISLQIHENLKKMRSYGLLTDVILKDIEGKSKKVHQCVLCSRSRKFTEEFRNKRNDKLLNSGKCGQIDTTMKTSVLDFFIEFIYSGILPSTLDLTTVFELLEAAIDYCVEDLKNICEDILTSKLDMHNVLDTLVFANTWKMLCLKKRALEFINTNKKGFLEEDSFISIQNPRLLREISIYTAGPNHIGYDEYEVRES